MNNPLAMIKSFMSGNISPQQIAMNMIGNNQSPVMNNLVRLAQNGDYKGVENIARNMFREQGIDFDKELKDFQNMITNFK